MICDLFKNILALRKKTVFDYAADTQDPEFRFGCDLPGCRSVLLGTNTSKKTSLSISNNATSLACNQEY